MYLISCASFFLPVQLIIAVAGVLTGYNGSFEFQEPGQEYGEYPYVGMRVVSHCVVCVYYYTFILLSVQCTIAKKMVTFQPRHNNGNRTGRGWCDETCSQLLAQKWCLKTKSKWLYLGAIGVNWQYEVDRSSIAYFKLSRASNTELTQVDEWQYWITPD